MSPPSRPAAIITLAAALETRNEPLAITSCCRSQSSTVVSSSGLEIDSPALLTTRSTPPNASAAASTAAATASSSDTSAPTATATSAPPISAARGRGLPGVEVGDDDACALGGQPGGDGLPDARCRPRSPARPGWPAASASASGRAWPPPAPSTRCGTSPTPGSGVGRHRLRAAHHVDRVDVELAGDPGGLLVLAEGEHAHARDQHDRRVGAPHRRASRGSRCARSRPGSPRGRRRAAPSAGR